LRNFGTTWVIEWELLLEKLQQVNLNDEECYSYTKIREMRGPAKKINI